MDTDKIEEIAGDVLRETGIRDEKFGEYHPSNICGCPLKVFLNKMTDKQTKLNKWLFSGSAVHFYMQEHRSPEGFDGILTEILHKAGYHALSTSYEVSNRYSIDDQSLRAKVDYDLPGDAHIVGTCDALCEGENGRTVFDLKYSSLQPSNQTGRTFYYLSQVNTYAHMFDADEYALILLNNMAGVRDSHPDSVADSVTVVDGTVSEDNWELVRLKALMIHASLLRYGYPGGDRWTLSELDKKPDEFWKEVMEVVEKKHCPAYEQECKYCDHSEYCPVYNGTLGGLKGMGR